MVDLTCFPFLALRCSVVVVPKNHNQRDRFIRWNQACRVGLLRDSKSGKPEKYRQIENELVQMIAN